MSQTNDLLARVRDVVRNQPEMPAYKVQGEGVTTYAQLWAHACHVADALLKRTSNRAPVIVLGKKSSLMVSSFLGCLMSGHAFVPVDSGLPTTRIHDIASQIEDTLVLATCDVSDELVELLPQSSVLDARKLAVEGQQAAEPDETVWVSGEQTQYIIFTSGSTGRPKGIEVTANCVGNFMRWMRTFPVVRDGGKVFLDQAPYSFDLSEYELVGALSTGGMLYAVTDDAMNDYGKLFAEVEESGVQVWVSTPSFADFCLVDKGFGQKLAPSLQMFLFCGEALHHTTVEALRKRFPDAIVANTYGPTESTVAITYGEIGQKQLDDPTPLPVGVARPGTEVHIVSRDTGAEVPRGQQGEIYIVGDTVAKGYYQNPQKTQQSFFDARMANGKHVRGYKTGDLGYLDQDGVLHCCGRLDSYIKLNGFRIELGEIEGTLEELPHVKQAAVVPVERNGRINRLRAYVVLHGHQEGKSFEEAQDLKAQLARLLPAYMVPRTVKVIDQMPLNANGKIDRKALKRG